MSAYPRRFYGKQVKPCLIVGFRPTLPQRRSPQCESQCKGCIKKSGCQSLWQTALFYSWLFSDYMIYSFQKIFAWQLRFVRRLALMKLQLHKGFFFAYLIIYKYKTTINHCQYFFIILNYINKLYYCQVEYLYNKYILFTKTA